MNPTQFDIENAAWYIAFIAVPIIFCTYIESQSFADRRHDRRRVRDDHPSRGRRVGK